MHTLPTAQVPSASTDSFSWCLDPFTHACEARPLTVVGWTSLSVIVIVIVLSRGSTGTETTVEYVQDQRCQHKNKQPMTRSSWLDQPAVRLFRFLRCAKMWEDCVRTALGVDVVEASREFLVLPNRKSLRTSLEHSCSRSHEKTKQTRRKLKTSVRQPMFTQRTKTTHAHTDSKHTSITASSTQRSWSEHRV